MQLQQRHPPVRARVPCSAHTVTTHAFYFGRQPCKTYQRLSRLGDPQLQARDWPTRRRTQASTIELAPTDIPAASGKLESTRLDSNVREKVQQAVESLRFEVTPGDVAARAGVTVHQAEEALTALAADTFGTLKVGALDGLTSAATA